MPSDDLHALALQVSQAARKYEEYVGEIERLGDQCAQTEIWARSIMGEVNPAFEQLFADIKRAEEIHAHTLLRCRNSLLKLAQALMKRM